MHVSEYEVPTTPDPSPDTIISTGASTTETFKVVKMSSRVHCSYPYTHQE